MIRTPTNSSQFIVLLLALTLFTWMSGMLEFQHQTDSFLLSSENFPGSVTDWQIRGNPDNIEISNAGVEIRRKAEKSSYAMLSLPTPSSHDSQSLSIRVRGKITTLTSASTVKNDQVAAFMIWFRGEDKNIIRYQTVQTLTGDFPEYRAERILSVPTEARSLLIVMINRASDGVFILTDAEVTIVSPSLIYTIVSSFMYLCWILLVVVALVWLIQRIELAHGIAIGGLISLIFMGILLPESVTNNQVLPAYNKVTEALSITQKEPLSVLYKLGHFVFFLCLSIILLINKEKIQFSTLAIFFVVLIFAIATEGLQLHLFNRTTRLSDVFIDLAGFAVALLVIHTVRSRIAINKN